MSLNIHMEDPDPIIRGDLAGWTPASREVYHAQARRLLSEGWELLQTSEATNIKDSFGFSLPEPGAMFTWVVFVHRAEMRCLAIWQFGTQLKGAPGTVHGGIICTAVDHTCGVHLALGHHAFPCVTLGLSVDYQRPVPLESPVIIEGKIDLVEGMKYHFTMAMKKPDGTKTYNTAKTVFLHIPVEKYGAKSHL